MPLELEQAGGKWTVEKQVLLTLTSPASGLSGVTVSGSCAEAAAAASGGYQKERIRWQRQR